MNLDGEFISFIGTFNSNINMIKYVTVFATQRELFLHVVSIDYFCHTLNFL